MAIQQKLYTAADLWELSHNESGKRYELIEGVIYEMAPAGGKHGVITSGINMLIGMYVKTHSLGYVTAAETGFSLTGDGKNVLAPDVGFVAKDRLSELPDGYIPLAPDFAVEVVSPNDRAGRIQIKVKSFLEWGTKLVWVVYPATQNVVVHTLSGSYTLGVDAALDGGDVLPGFQLPVKDIFSD